MRLPIYDGRWTTDDLEKRLASGSRDKKDARRLSAATPGGQEKEVLRNTLLGRNLNKSNEQVNTFCPLSPRNARSLTKS